ncbi:MAG: hypothetical protein WCL00_07145 [Bacteroidota bacterium]
MDRRNRKYFPFRVVNGFEATSFFIGYMLLTAVLAETIFNRMKYTYILYMSFGLLIICLVKLWAQKRN